METKLLPSWIESFDFLVIDEYKTVLYCDSEFPPEDFMFKNPLGCIVGDTVIVCEKEYEVIEFHVYCDKNPINEEQYKTEKYGLTLHIIVREIVD